MDHGKVIAAIGLGVTALVVAAAIGLGCWQAKVGCEDFARREGREIVANRWWGKGNYCETRSADGTFSASNQTRRFMFLIVLASIPVGLAAGAGAIVAYGWLCSSPHLRVRNP